jgi:hypothetical protein
VKQNKTFVIEVFSCENAPITAIVKPEYKYDDNSLRIVLPRETEFTTVSIPVLSLVEFQIAE